MLAHQTRLAKAVGVDNVENIISLTSVQIFIHAEYVVPLVTSLVAVLRQNGHILLVDARTA